MHSAGEITKEWNERHIYAILKQDYTCLRPHVSIHTEGVFRTLEDAIVLFEKMPEDDNTEIWIEEWPLGELKTRFNTFVVSYVK